MLYGPSLSQSTVAMDTKNHDSLNSSAPPAVTSTSKTGFINPDLSTKKHSPILLTGSDMLSDNGAYLQDHGAGKPCLAGYPSGEHLNLKSLNQARANLWRQRLNDLLCFFETKFAANALSIIYIFD